MDYYLRNLLTAPFLVDFLLTGLALSIGVVMAGEIVVDSDC